MPWLISRALMEAYESSLCSRGPVAESSEVSCSDGEPSAQSSTSPTPHAYSSPDRMMALSHRSLSGLMFEPLTVDRGVGVLMWCLGVGPVPTYRAPERALESPGPSLGCGWKWRASFARYDPASYSWRTRQCSLLGDSESYSETWPRWGSMLSGECLERIMPALHTSATESGSWLPTPMANDVGGYNKGGGSGRVGKVRPGLKMMARKNLWPTPKASDGARGDCPSERARRSPSLVSACKWPTPTARDWKSGAASQATYDRNARPLNEMVHQAEGGGQMNPTWVGLLMGWPEGWASLEPLGHGVAAEWAKGGASAWQAGQWENGVPRVATGVANRKHRLKAIGNGQVPAVAALAWRTLRGRR